MSENAEILCKGDNNMGIVKFKQSVRDGYLEDLPGAIQSKITSICKIITNKLNEKIKDEHYEDLTNSNWAMSCLDEFRTPPTMKGEVGSVRVYKSGKQYKCMIQVTGHFRNHQYGWIEELLHEIIADTFQEVRPEIRRKFDVTLSNESTRGNPNEGFDVFLSNKLSEEVWNLFEGRKTRAIKESSDEYLDEGFFDNIFKKKSKDPNPNVNVLDPNVSIPPAQISRKYITITLEDKAKIISNVRKIESDVSAALKPLFDRYPVYGLRLSPISDKDIDREFITKDDCAYIEITNNAPDIVFTISIHGIDQYDFMDIMEKEHADEVERLRAAGYDLESRSEWTDIHWMKKILGYDKSLDEICKEMESIIKSNFTFIKNFQSCGDNDSGPLYNGDIDSTYICQDINTTNIIEANPVTMRESVEISYDLAMYYECYQHTGMSYDQYFEEKSHGKLKYDFRLGFDYDTGHRIKVVYSLDGIKVTATGGRYLKQMGKSIYSDKDSKFHNDHIRYIQKNISKDGNTDHMSKGQKVLAIVDLEYNRRMDECNLIGLYNQYIPSTTFNSKLTRDQLAKLHESIEDRGTEYYKKVVNKIKVGKIDKNASFKSTYLWKGIDDDKNVIHKMADSEKLRSGRGAKLGDIQADLVSNILDNPVKYAHPSKRDIKRNPELYKKESANNTPEYNVDMTEVQAKRTLRTLSQDIINKTKADKNYKITQYTANIYANIITKNLLPKWASGYKKLSITLDSYQSFFTLEFKIPTMSQDFVSRFINGREPINAFLHRVPEIKIKMSPRIFHTMQDPDDAFTFFKAAVKYYDQKVENYSKKLMSEAMKLNHSMKHLISTTNLSGIVTLPMQLLFVFDDVHMNNAKTFLLSDEDLRAVNSFIKGIYTKYAAPEKEKKRIIEDVKTLVKDLRESCEIDDNIRSLTLFPESVEKWLIGDFDADIQKANDEFIREQVDLYEMNNPSSSELQYIREKFGVKKLKRIPNDLVAYISIETEAIETPNDKLMIASYCLSKIEIVEWYIELLEVGSKKYIVPHSLPFLQNVRTQLLQCYKNIMTVKVGTNKNRPIIDIQYPKGYEG